MHWIQPSVEETRTDLQLTCICFGTELHSTEAVLLQEADKSKSFFVNTRTDLAAADYFNTVRRTEKPVTLQEASKISPEDLRQVRLVHHAFCGSTQPASLSR